MDIAPMLPVWYERHFDLKSSVVSTSAMSTRRLFQSEIVACKMSVFMTVCRTWGNLWSVLVRLSVGAKMLLAWIKLFCLQFYKTQTQNLRVSLYIHTDLTSNGAHHCTKLSTRTGHSRLCIIFDTLSLCTYIYQLQNVLPFVYIV